jgi:hypothetical protein
MSGAPWTAIAANTGMIVTIGCIYTALSSPFFFGAPCGAVLGILSDTMPFVLAAWVLALVFGLGLLCVGIGRYIRKGGKGANGWASLFIITGGAFFLRISSVFPPNEDDLARLVARGGGSAVIVLHMANLIMVLLGHMHRTRAQRLVFPADPPAWADPQSGRPNPGGPSAKTDKKHWKERARS